jgi:hypothetical protein
MRGSANSDVPVLLVRPEDAATALGVSRTKIYELSYCQDLWIKIV